MTNVVVHTDDGGELRAWDPRPDVPLRVEVEDADPGLPVIPMNGRRSAGSMTNDRCDVRCAGPSAQGRDDVEVTVAPSRTTSWRRRTARPYGLSSPSTSTASGTRGAERMSGDMPAIVLGISSQSSRARYPNGAMVDDRRVAARRWVSVDQQAA